MRVDAFCIGSGVLASFGSTRTYVRRLSQPRRRGCRRFTNREPSVGILRSLVLLPGGLANPKAPRCLARRGAYRCVGKPHDVARQFQPTSVSAASGHRGRSRVPDIAGRLRATARVCFQPARPPPSGEACPPDPDNAPLAAAQTPIGCDPFPRARSLGFRERCVTLQESNESARCALPIDTRKSARDWKNKLATFS